MNEWDFAPPPESKLTDHEVVVRSQYLQGKHLALLISGSIAAYRTPDLIREFRRHGAKVTVFATSEALRYVTREALEWTSLQPVVVEFTAQAEHLHDSQPFDAYLVAPATYSVINKIAHGIADNVVTSTLASAIGRMERMRVPVLVAPAMHGSMHNSLLVESLHRLKALGARIIQPRQENGKDNLPTLEILIAETIAALSRSRLYNYGLLVTGGPTPVPIDNIRRITTKFSGALAIEIAKTAYYRDMRVQLILGHGSIQPPNFLKTHWIHDYDQYCHTVNRILEHDDMDFGVFSAAVADYRPKTVYAGKIPSGQAEPVIQLTSTKKVIQEVRATFPKLRMATFKYEENLSHEALLEIARSRLGEGYQWVVANRGEEQGKQQEQIAWILSATSSTEPVQAVGKPQIAKQLLDLMERSV